MSGLLGDIIDTNATNEGRALACLRRLDDLRPPDVGIPDLRHAAQTFALLAVADELRASQSGLSLTDVIARAGGINA